MNRVISGRYGTFEQDTNGDLIPVRVHEDLLRKSTEDHDRGLSCACCGKVPAVMGFGGQDGDGKEIPACDLCISMYSFQEFDARIAEWCRKQGRTPRIPWKLP